LKQDEIKFMLI